MATSPSFSVSFLSSDPSSQARSSDDRGGDFSVEIQALPLTAQTTDQVTAEDSIQNKDSFDDTEQAAGGQVSQAEGSSQGELPTPNAGSGSQWSAAELMTAEPKAVPKVVDIMPSPPLQQREQRKSQDLFAALAFACRSFKNLNQVLELTTFVASQLTDADGSVLVMFEPNGQLRLEQVHGMDPEYRDQLRTLLERSTQVLSESIAAADGIPQVGSSALVLEDALDFGAWLEHLLDQQFQQDLGSHVYLRGTPLLMRSTVRGRLYVFSAQLGYEWTEERQQLLRMVADQASVAIENDELTASLRRQAALGKELEIGSEIQSRLLPRTFPCVPGIQMAARCKTASQVGGDYYDFIEIKSQSGSRRVGIVIGDVMGKGVPAGLLMTTMRGMLRAEVMNDHRPARILQHLNHVMYDDLEQAHRFISLFYSDYEPASGHLCFSNAAHNPTLLWRSTTQELDYLDTAGQLLGLEQEGQFEERCVQLQPGDVVVYYTDGFTEAANARGERLESTGLESAVRYAAQLHQDPQAILECLFDQVETFRQTAQKQHRTSSAIWSHLTEDELRLLPELDLRERVMAPDDMTMVVVKVAPVDCPEAVNQAKSSSH